MGSLNHCAFIGHLGRDAELKYLQGGDAVSTFSIACSEAWTDKGGNRQERTEWVRINLWGKLAESLTEYLTKGKQVYVAGKLSTRKWQDKDGVDRYSTEIRAEKVVLLGSGGGQRNSRDDASDRREREPVAAGNVDDDIPF